MSEQYITKNGVDGAFAYTLWATDGARSRVVGHYPELEAIPEHEGLEAYAFEVATSFAPRTPFNKSSAPVADAHGAPLWAGARIRFGEGPGDATRKSGLGEAREVSGWYGLTYLADQPQRVQAVAPGIGPVTHGYSREQYFAFYEHQRGTVLDGLTLLRATSTHWQDAGRIKDFIELADDPRRVCLVLDRSAAPGLRR